MTPKIRLIYCLLLVSVVCACNNDAQEFTYDLNSPPLTTVYDIFENVHWSTTDTVINFNCYYRENVIEHTICDIIGAGSCSIVDGKEEHEALISNDEKPDWAELILDTDKRELSIKFKPNTGDENRYVDIITKSVTKEGHKIFINIYIHQQCK